MIKSEFKNAEGPEAVGVSLSRVRWVQGKRTLVAVANARTDDRGICRLFGIPRDSYYLSATYRHFEMPREHGQAPVSTYYPGLRLG